MKFRPCIDIHNGKVKQIIGGSLRDKGNQASENFISEYDAAYYSNLYKKNKLSGGHIILLNSKDSDYYEKTKTEAISALKEYRGGLQIGGGIHADNAAAFLDCGASHVIVTSYVFQNGEIDYKNLKKIKEAVGKERLVIDLSCRKKENQYYIVTDRWQKYTNVVINQETLNFFADFCNEFLIHAVDVEGKAEGVEIELIKLLGEWNKIPITYAGGVHSFEDLDILKELGKGKIDVTIGSSLDLFGGKMKFQEVLNRMSQE